MVKQKEVIDEVTKRGMKVKVMVGGAPVTREWVHKIEADATAVQMVACVQILFYNIEYLTGQRPARQAFGPSTWHLLFRF